jgi:hypothetical protein
MERDDDVESPLLMRRARQVGGLTAHPDLLGYHLLHQGMRADTARLQTAVDGLTEPERTRRGASVARWYAGFLGEFDHHHMVEDDILFPALAARCESFRTLLPRLHEEHERLERALNAVSSDLGALRDPAVSWSIAHPRARRSVETAGAELNGHLDYEDSSVLPLFEAHMSAVDYGELEQQAARSLPRAQIAFSVPWLLSQADPTERRHLLQGAPFVLRLLWYVTRGRYRRLVVRAFG